MVRLHEFSALREVDSHIVVFIDEFGFQGMVERSHFQLLVRILLKVVAEVKGVRTQPGVWDGFADEGES